MKEHDDFLDVAMTLPQECREELAERLRHNLESSSVRCCDEHEELLNAFTQGEKKLTAAAR